MYKVYAKTDSAGRIISINSDAFLSDITDLSSWVLLESNVQGDKGHHAQGHYLEKPLTTEQGIYQYKLVGGKVVERTAAEIAADVANIPPPPPSAEDRIRALETKLAELEPTITTLTRDVAAVKTQLPIVKEPIVKEALI